MKLSEMKTNDELIAELLRTDPEFRAEWERTALAREVALAIVRYRADHDLSQRDLAKRLGMKQPQVARMELGEVNPSMETLMRVSAQLGIEFTIDVRPAGTTVHNVRSVRRPTTSSAQFAPAKPRFSSPRDRKTLHAGGVHHAATASGCDRRRHRAGARSRWWPSGSDARGCARQAVAR